MNKRCYKIIEILIECGTWMTGKELAYRLAVSSRTIRSDIEKIHNTYPHLIVAHYRNGYCLDQEVLNKTTLATKSNTIPQSPEERVNYIISTLLFRATPLHLMDLEDHIYVSDSTIKSDLKTIQDLLENYESLSIDKDGSFIRLVGSEEDKRALYRDLLAKECQGNFANINKIDELLPNLDMIRIKNELEATLDQYQFSIRKETLPSLLIHAGCGLERMRQACYVDQSLVADQTDKAYQIARTFYQRVARFIPIQANDHEISLLARLLDSRSSLTLGSEDFAENAVRLCDQIVEGIFNQYDIDFSDDAYFKSSFALHIQNLLKRVDTNHTLSTDSLLDIKRNFPLIFEMSVFIGRLIEKDVGIPLPETELEYLAIHIGTAYDRQFIQCWHAILIQPSGNMMSNLCQQKLTEKFGDQLVIDAVCDYYEAELVERYQPDLILSTVPLSHETGLPAVLISTLMTANDVYKIAKLLNELESQSSWRRFSKYVHTLVQDDCYFYQLNVETKEEVINCLADRLYELGAVTNQFKESTFAREKRAFTSFRCGFAIPHPIDYETKHSRMGIAILKKPIRWGEYDVKFVLLLAIRQMDKDLLKVFFDWFSDLSENDGLMTRLLEAKDAQAFIHLIESRYT